MPHRDGRQAKDAGTQSDSGGMVSVRSAPRYAAWSVWWHRASGWLRRAARRLDGVAVGIMAGALLLRFLLIALGWPLLNSDEGTFGLEAMHIAFRGEHPVFLYGQQYMGVLEAYLGALSFRLFGVSTLSLRLGLLLLYAIFLASVYVLARHLYSRRIARLSLLALALGGPLILYRQLSAVGGVLETICFGALLLALTAHLTLAPEEKAPKGWRRTSLYALWGVAAGLGLWSDLLIVPIVLMAGLWLAVGCHRELWGWRGVTLLLGALLGALPLISYNLGAAPGQDSLHVFLRLIQANGAGQAADVTLPQGIARTVFISLPSITGGAPFCPLPHTILPRGAHANLVGYVCFAVNAGWGLGWLILWGCSALIALRGVRRAWATRAKWSPASRAAAYRSVGQLAVLGSAALTLLAYASSPVPVLAPLDSGRYLVGLWIATSALLAPLALPRLAGEQAPPEPAPMHAREGSSLTRLSALPLALILAMLALGVAATWREVPGKRQLHEQSQALIASLARAGVTRVYADYWTCDQLMFESRERVICAVLAPQMNAGYDRYPAYAVMVRAAAHPAFLFPLGSPQAGIIARLSDDPGVVPGGAGGRALDVAPDAVLPASPLYHLQRVDGYVLYRYLMPTYPARS